MVGSVSKDFGATDAVNLARYPIDDLQSPAGAAFAAECRRTFAETGLCMLHDFVHPAAMDVMIDETTAVADKAFYCRNTHNAYLTADDESLPADDLRRRQESTFVGSIAYDMIPENALLRRVYNWDPLKEFIAAVLGKPVLYRFADPLGACSINVFSDGGQHGWHFDESEFTVTLMVQPPEQGGAFEYVPGIRGRTDEQDIVEAVLAGGRDGVETLPFTPGTLLIFGGQKTLHRVTEVRGARLRLVPVLCYSVEPDLKNSDEVRMLFWGRTGSEAAA